MPTDNDPSDVDDPDVLICFGCGDIILTDDVDEDEPYCDDCCDPDNA